MAEEITITEQLSQSSYKLNYEIVDVDIPQSSTTTKEESNSDTTTTPTPTVPTENPTTTEKVFR